MYYLIKRLLSKSCVVCWTSPLTIPSIVDWLALVQFPIITPGWLLHKQEQNRTICSANMYLVVIRSSAGKQSICLNPRDHPADVDVLPAAAAAVAALSICSPSQCYVVITVVMEVRNDGRATDRPTGRHIRMDKRRWCCSDRTIGYNRYLSSNPGDAYEI